MTINHRVSWSVPTPCITEVGTGKVKWYRQSSLTSQLSGLLHSMQPFGLLVFVIVPLNWALLIIPICYQAAIIVFIQHSHCHTMAIGHTMFFFQASLHSSFPNFSLLAIDIWWVFMIWFMKCFTFLLFFWIILFKSFKMIQSVPNLMVQSFGLIA